MNLAYASNVRALMHFNTSSGLSDGSDAARTFTATGGAAASTADSKFGDGSLYVPFNGGISTPWSDQGFGSGDFTVECFVKALNARHYLIDAWGAQDGWLLGSTPSGCLQWVQNGNIKTGTIPYADGAWHHIAVSRVGGFLRFFVDGVMDGVEVSDTVVLAGSAQLYVGYRGSYPLPELDFSGYIDELRISNGVGRYTESFTPPSGEFVLDPLPASNMSCPAALASGYGGGASSIIPKTAVIGAFGGGSSSVLGTFPTIQASAHDSTGENAAALILPSSVMSSFGGGNSAIGISPPSAHLSGTVAGLGVFSLKTPSPTLTASGTVSGTAHAAIAPRMATLIGYSGAVCSITPTGRPTLQASGTAGAIGGAALTCPLFELTASGTAQNHGAANLLAPAARLGATAQAWLIAPGATLTAIGLATIAVTREAYAINLNHDDPAANDEVTRYTNFPFTQIVRYQGSYFGVAADGLYLLEGTTDDGEAIPWAFKTAMTDFKSPFRKTVVSAYFGGRLGPAATINLHVGEDGATAYNYSTVRSDHAQCYRHKFGRGLTAHYYALGVAGTGTLELDNIEFDTMNSTRRI